MEVRDTFLKLFLTRKYNIVSSLYVKNTFSSSNTRSNVHLSCPKQFSTSVNELREMLKDEYHPVMEKITTCMMKKLRRKKKKNISKKLDAYPNDKTDCLTIKDVTHPNRNGTVEYVESSKCPPNPCDIEIEDALMKCIENSNMSTLTQYLKNYHSISGKSEKGAARRADNLLPGK